MRMGAAKGAGYVETVKRPDGTVKGYRARRTVDGRPALGETRSTKLAAEKDRLKLLTKKTAKAKVSTIPTVREYAESMMNGAYGGRLAESTFQTNDTVRIVQLNPSALGKTRLDKVRKSHCQEFVDGLRTHVTVVERISKVVLVNGRKKTVTEKVSRVEERTPSPSYLRRVWAFISTVITQAYEDEVLGLGGRHCSPVHGIRLPEVGERENRTLEPKEAIRLLNPRSRLEAMLLVALHTGMRRAEVCRLKWEHVSDARIKVPGTKSKKSRSAVPTTPEVWKAIQSQSRVICSNGKPSPYVFATETGGMIDPHNFTRDFSKWKKGNDFPAETRIQDLRGSYVSLLIESGVDIKTVQELARHESPITTMRMYARSRQEVQVEAVLDKLRSKIVPFDEPQHEEIAAKQA